MSKWKLTILLFYRRKYNTKTELQSPNELGDQMTRISYQSKSYIKTKRPNIATIVVIINDDKHNISFAQSNALADVHLLQNQFMRIKMSV